jgi:hypothetical protein
MIKNIRFEYADNVLPDKEREQHLANQTNLWFEPFIDELNNQSGTIDFFLKEGFENRVSFNGIDKNLEDKLYQRIKIFQVKY